MIKLLRLVTGEDVISDVEKRENFLILRNPHRLVFTQEGLGSMPLCPFSSSTTYEISLNNILFEAEPESQIRDSYASQTGSIVIPTTTLLAP